MKTTIGRPREGAFISYARADGEAAALALCARLETDAPDVPAWLDRYQIEGGAGWWNQIEQALDRAEFLLLVMTPAAMHSENTRREWRSARQRGVCVYPVKGAADADLDYASLPNWMRKAHFYDPPRETVESRRWRGARDPRRPQRRGYGRCHQRCRYACGDGLTRPHDQALAARRPPAPRCYRLACRGSRVSRVQRRRPALRVGRQRRARDRSRRAHGICICGTCRAAS